ncbi:MAG: radical SAM protein [Candidatus Lokiarchaeota archaeon]|nr:radical SAM protein [Candidatus Lokiarchaeota archaeon]
MKVSLIFPTPPETGTFCGTVKEAEKYNKDKIEFYGFPPMGILYLGTYLSENNFDVSILDQFARGFSIKETLKWIKHEDPDILGFSTITTAGTGRSSAEIAKRVKEEINPNVKVLFGNYHATFNDTRILNKYSFIDACIRGEGEKTLLEIAEKTEKGRGFEEIRGVTYRDNGRIVRNDDRPLLENIDNLPIPNRKLLGNVKYKNKVEGLDLSVGKFTSAASSRGCAFQCSFCSSSMFWGKWRPRSPENIVEELSLLEEQGYNNLLWVDDNFTISKKRLFNLSDLIKKEKLDFNWMAEGRVTQSSKELLHAMKQMGCKVLSFGVESGSQRLLDWYNKKVTLNQIYDAVKNSKKVGIDMVLANFIVGAPIETREEIIETLNFSLKLDIDFPQFHILGIIPGNWIWDMMVKEKKINPDDCWEVGTAVLPIPLSEIIERVRQAHIKFMKRPSFISRQILKTLKSRYRQKAIWQNFKNLERWDIWNTWKPFWG